MNKGQKIKFFIHDNLFKDNIIATGIIIDRKFGRLWSVEPDPHKRLTGIRVTVHESNMLG